MINCTTTGETEYAALLANALARLHTVRPSQAWPCGQLAPRSPRGASASEGELRLEELVEQAPFPISVFDASGVLLLCNAEFSSLWQGLPIPQPGQFNILEFPAVSASSLGDVVRLAFAGRGTAMHEGELSLGQAGQAPRKLHLRSRVFPTFDPSGVLRNVFLMQEDISQQKSMEEELAQSRQELGERNERLEAARRELERLYQRERSNRQVLEKSWNKLRDTQAKLIQSAKMASVGQLMAGIAHEFNNPINYLGASLETLETFLGDILELHQLYQEHGHDEPGRERIEQFRQDKQMDQVVASMGVLLKNMRAGVNRSNQVVKQLQAFSRQEDGMRWADLNQNLRTSLNLIGHEYRGRVRLRPELSPLPAISCNPSKISQMFVNILLNAFQAITGVGEVMVSSFFLEKELEAVFLITDSGDGMTEDLASRAFEPFFSTKAKTSSLGLGLSISQDIAHQHCGRIVLESRPGLGTTVRVHLPLK